MKVLTDVHRSRRNEEKFNQERELNRCRCRQKNVFLNDDGPTKKSPNWPKVEPIFGKLNFCPSVCFSFLMFLLFVFSLSIILSNCLFTFFTFIFHQSVAPLSSLFTMCVILFNLSYYFFLSLSYSLIKNLRFQFSGFIPSKIEKTFDVQNVQSFI